MNDLFTNEFEPDSTVTTIIDNDGQFGDVEIIIGEDIVYIRQFDNDMETMDVIQMSPFMFREIWTALNHTEGVFLTNFESNHK